MSALEDYAVKVAMTEWTGGSAHDWEQAFTGKDIEACRGVMRSFTKGAAKIMPVDFLKAWARAHPREICPTCDGTGQVFDDHLDQWQPCSCPEGKVRPLAAGAIIVRNRRLPDQTCAVGLEALTAILGGLKPDAQQALDEIHNRRAS